MNRFATSAAAFALLMTSVAFAQTDPATPDAAPPATSQAAPTTEIPLPASPGADAAAQDASPAMRRMGSDEDDDDDDDDDDDEGERGRGGEGDRLGVGGRGDGDSAGADRGGHGGRGGEHGMRGHPGWRMHHGGMGMGGQGAVFRFSRGEGGPSIMIRCAAQDSTADCVDAIMPMLETLLQRSTAAPGQ